MFKFKEILDGIIDDILELPAMWVRTHVHALTYGRRAPFVIEHRLAHDNKRYLKLRTAAFVDILIVYAFSKATGTSEAFSNNFLIVLLQPQNINLSDSVFLSLAIAFLGFYYAFYVIVERLPLRTSTARVISGACLFYSVFCMAFCIIVFVALFGSGSILAKDYVIRTTIYAFDAIIFWRLGSIFVSRLHIRRLTSRPRLFTAVVALLCFAIYASVAWICFGRDLLWPVFGA